MSSDASGDLVVTAAVRSSAGTVVVALRASLYDAGGKLVGDASGGELHVGPNLATSIKLTGPPAMGTVSKVVFEVSSTAVATLAP